MRWRPGRRRGTTAFYTKLQGGGESFGIGGDILGRRSGCRLNPDPREEEGVGYSILLARRRVTGDAVYVEAMDAKIGKLAVRQAIQFVDRLAEDCATGEVVADRTQREAVRSFAGRTMVKIKNSHFRLPSHHQLRPDCLCC